MEQVQKAPETKSFNIDKMEKGHYMAFTVKNNSMDGGKKNDTPNGAKILCRELQKQHWADGFPESEYGWVIVGDKDTYHADITGFDKNTGAISCSTRNPKYSGFSLKPDECRQIFKVVQRSY